LINCYKLKLFLISFACLCLSSKASLLWNINDGILQYKYGKYKEAESFFINYLKNNPNDKEGYYELAQTYLKLKNPLEASKNFEKSYSLTLKDINLEKIKFDNSNISNLQDYFDMAVMYFKEGNFQEADFYADMMLKLDNKNADAFFLKAKIANSKGEIEEAKKFLENAVLYNNKLLKTNLAKKLNVYSIPSVSKENYHMFAFEEYFKGNIEQAISNCERYVELDKTNPEINILLSKLYLKQGDPKKALEIIEEAKKTGENIGYYLLEADIYNFLDESDKEKNALLKAYKINPNNTEMLYKAGNFYLKKGDYKTSIKYFEALINTDDSFYEGYFGYIKNLIELGKTDNAIVYARKAISNNKEGSEGDYLLALICFEQGQFEESLDYITEAILKHNNPNYLLLKAKIEYYLKNYDKSLETLNEIKKISYSVYNPKEVDKYYLKNYFKLDQYQMAQYYFNNSDFALDKNSLIYKYNLYKTYKLQGNDKKADFLYNQIKNTGLNSIEDCVDLSEIIFEEQGLEEAIRLLDKAIKKFPDEYGLYSQKVIIYSVSNNEDKVKDTLNKMSEIFN